MSDHILHEVYKCHTLGPQSILSIFRKAFTDAYEGGTNGKGKQTHANPHVCSNLGTSYDDTPNVGRAGIGVQRAGNGPLVSGCWSGTDHVDWRVFLSSYE